jgi:hypothetical protein
MRALCVSIRNERVVAAGPVEIVWKDTHMTLWRVRAARVRWWGGKRVVRINAAPSVFERCGRLVLQHW